VEGATESKATNNLFGPTFAKRPIEFQCVFSGQSHRLVGPLLGIPVIFDNAAVQPNGAIDPFRTRPGDRSVRRCYRTHFCCMMLFR